MYHTQSTTYNKAAAYTGTIGTAAHDPGSTPRRPLLPYTCVIYVYINYICIIYNVRVTIKAAAYTGTIGTDAHDPGSTPRRPLLPYIYIVYVHINYIWIIFQSTCTVY